MKIKTLSVSALLLAPALLAFQPQGTSISFHVEEGATKTKTFTNSIEMTLDDMSMLMNGQESPMMPDISLDVAGSFEVTVSDEYGRMRDGKPGRLTRTFDSIDENKKTEMEMDMMGQVTTQSSDVGAESELVGTTVQFNWDEDAEEFVASFPNEDADEKLLEDLTEDMDLRGLLPDDEVSEGDEWDVDLMALKDLLSPGGDLKLIPEEQEEGADMMGMNSDLGDSNDWFNEDMEGEVTATFTEIRETGDGIRVAVITLLIEVSNAVDLTEQIQEELDNSDQPPEVEDMQVESMDLEIELDGEGILLWNLAEGCLHSLEIENDLSVMVDISMAVSAQGMNMNIEQSLEFSGTFGAQVMVEE